MIEKHLNILHGKHICVIGDVILDVFRIGHVQRVSQEAPVPILDIEEDHDCLGGALNVCNNILSLGASCDIIAVIGDDASYLDGMGEFSKKNAKKHPELVIEALKNRRGKNRKACPGAGQSYKSTQNSGDYCCRNNYRSDPGHCFCLYN